MNFEQQHKKDRQTSKPYETFFFEFQKRINKQQVEHYDNPKNIEININGIMSNGIKEHFPDIGIIKETTIELFDIKSTAMNQMPLELQCVEASVKWNAPMVWFFKSLGKVFVIQPDWVSQYYKKQIAREQPYLSNEGRIKHETFGKGNKGIMLNLYEFEHLEDKTLSQFYQQARQINLLK